MGANCPAVTGDTLGILSEGARRSMALEGRGVTEGSLQATHPQLTQAMVPWPFTVWATSDSNFRCESPDVAAGTERRKQR